MHTPRARLVVLLRFAALALWLLAPGAATAQFLSPGPVSKEHQEVDGDDDCARCHEQGEGVPDRLCLDCHRPIQARMNRGSGYHARVTKTERCAKCHEEHLGRDGRLVRWPGGAPERFNHLQAGWALTGGHLDTKCRDCHKAEYRQEGNLPDTTWLGLPTDCAVCHKADDPHKGQFGNRKCETCHVTEEWKALQKFDHAKTKFPLRDKHADVKCAECHEKGKYAGVTTTCAGCHETPHPKATDFGEKCERCHTEKAWNVLNYARAEHKKFPLEGGHAKPKCTDCHGAKAVVAPPKDCVECHKKDDAHKGQFGRKCQSCHQISDWRTLKKGAEIDHDKTAFPLRGEHVGVECGQCHKDARFKPVAHEACLDCHKDPHEGAVGTKCEDCHVVDGFRPSLYPLEKHTRFTLTGAHRAVACNDCHRPKPRTPAADKAPAHRPGEHPLDFRKGVNACSGCHKDVHDGQFAPRSCDACHTTQGWLGGAFKHDVWPLTGKHATTACASCHPEGNFAGVSRECRDCHGDPHLGQFVAGPPVKACTTCHTTDAWKGKFDHTSIWPLEGVHAKAQCAACHKEVHVGDARVTVRWRLGFNDCARCHENVHRKAKP
jgi:hypothetical protein